VPARPFRRWGVRCLYPLGKVPARPFRQCCSSSRTSPVVISFVFVPDCHFLFVCRWHLVCCLAFLRLGDWCLYPVGKVPDRPSHSCCPSLVWGPPDQIPLSLLPHSSDRICPSRSCSVRRPPVRCPGHRRLTRGCRRQWDVGGLLLFFVDRGAFRSGSGRQARSCSCTCLVVNLGTW
jgi:hypothetical protein